MLSRIYNRGNSFYNNKEYSSAINEYLYVVDIIDDELREGDTKNIELYQSALYNLGTSYIKTEDFKKSMECFSTILEKFPITEILPSSECTQARVLFNMAFVSCKMGDNLLGYQLFNTLSSCVDVGEQDKECLKAIHNFCKHNLK